jgi:hypothetical protein
VSLFRFRSIYLEKNHLWFVLELWKAVGFNLCKLKRLVGFDPKPSVKRISCKGLNLEPAKGFVGLTREIRRE